MESNPFQIISDKLDLVLTKLDSMTPRITFPSPTIIRLPDFCKQHNISRPTCYSWADRGLIKMKKIGGRQFVEIDSIKFTKKYQRNG